MRRRSTGLAFALLLVCGMGAIYVVSQTYTIDKYAGQPQVVGLPPGYDPMAPATPYRGVHRSRLEPLPDPYPYPIAVGEQGPVVPTYADELQYPFACRSEGSSLGQPLVDNQDGAGIVVFEPDEDGRKTERIAGYSKDCGLQTRVDYYYRDRRSGAFVPVTGQGDDVEYIERSNGTRVPFVVRLESGTINRHIYLIAMLRGGNDDQSQPDTGYWNGKLIYMLRGGVGIGRRQGRIEPAYILNRNTELLAQGYAVAHSTANQTSTQYDIELAEDSMARVKRQFIARYGEPRYTIGIGKSGGAIQQYLIGQNRPGLLDGGIAQYSYPDMATQTTKIMDCELLEYFFDVLDADNPKWRRRSQRSWIMGFNALDDASNLVERMLGLQALRRGRWPEVERGHTECSKGWRNLTPQIVNPRYTYFASLFAPQVRARVAWTYWDDLKRIYGTDDRGFGRRTWDNVGVQYGLAALRAGHISVDEFIDLNARVGGWLPAAQMRAERFWLFAGGRSDLVDFSPWSQHNMTNGHGAGLAQRSVGDLDAIAAAYRSGQVFLGELEMPIIDLRHYLEPQLDMHHSLQSFSARLRMQRQQGHADNQIIWFALRPAAPEAEALELLERWLENRLRNPLASAAETRPEDADDRCYDRDGTLIARGSGVWDGVWNGKAAGACMEKMPVYSNPRIVAGDDYAGDIFKCHLQTVQRAIDRGVYAPLDGNTFRERLEETFPDGVCDYARGDAGRPADLLSKLRPATAK